MIETLNVDLFNLINADDRARPWVVEGARILAEGPVWGAVVIVVVLWVRGSAEKRQALLSTGLGLACSLAGAFMIADVWPHLRPAELGLGRQLLFHAAEASFPSDHVTFLLTIGLGFLSAGRIRAWGGLICALAIGTAWARVYLGIHFPLDMFGALLLALVGALVTRLTKPRLAVVLLPHVVRVYETILRVLHFPRAAFPRK